jgi:membrane-bound lytic murein transglycosylase B
MPTAFPLSYPLSGRFGRFVAVLLLGLVTTAGAASAEQTPRQWVQSFWKTASAAGVDRATYDRALSNFTPDPDVIKRANSQAEFNMAIWNYMDQMVSDERIAQGRIALQQYGDLLARIEAKYGVDRYTLLAVWGMESHYGAVLKNPRIVKNVIRSLATLAYSGGRLAKFGRTQLVAALKILERGDISLDNMTGSWAGAMGQTQFIPTTFLAYAVDFEGDGHRNIWTSPADALASAANYLKKSGWQAGATWGYEVVVPASYDIRKDGARSLASWANLGVRRVAGRAFPRGSEKATLYLPNGRQGPAFLLVANFRVIKRYNSSNSYALAVGHLADRIRGGDPFVASWPQHEPTLSEEESELIQAYLTTAGFYDGPIDGDIGSGSREAIRNYQRKIGLNPDGVPTRDLLQRLQKSQ